MPEVKDEPIEGTWHSLEVCRIRKLEDKVNQLEARIEALQSRCDLALKELTGLKRKQMDLEDESRKRAKPNVDTREPTSTDVHGKAQEPAPAETAEPRSHFPSQEAERDQEHGPFTGALASKAKTKTDLIDVAQALQLTTSGTKKDLLERINAHFNAHPEKRVDPIFAGLFTSRHRPIANNENSPIPSSSTAPFQPYTPNPGPPSGIPYVYHEFHNALPNPSYPAHYLGPAPYPLGNAYPYYSYIGSPYNLPY